MKWMRKPGRPSSARRAAMAWVIGALAMGCGASVEALDARDPTLPVETRSWIAGAEDGVIVARAELDMAKGERRRVARWAARVEESLEGALDGALEALVEARTREAELAVEEAEVGLELALAKQELVYAESAVRHDRASYDLGPLREGVDALRERAREAGRATSRAEMESQTAANAFWEAYGRYAAGGGDTTEFWVAGVLPE